MGCVQAGSVLRARKPGGPGSTGGKAKGPRRLTALELELWDPLLQLLPEDERTDEAGVAS